MLDFSPDLRPYAAEADFGTGVAAHPTAGAQYLSKWGILATKPKEKLLRVPAVDIVIFRTLGFHKLLQLPKRRVVKWIRC